MNKAIEEEVVRATLNDILLKNGLTALSLGGENTHFSIVPLETQVQEQAGAS